MKRIFSNPWFYFRLGGVAMMFMAVAFFYERLPDPLPIHWNFEGQVDHWGPKRFHSWVMALLALGMTLLFPVLARLDPRGHNYEAFAPTWERLQTALILFFAYMQGVLLYLILTPVPARSIAFWMQLGVGVLFVLIGNWMGKIRSNYFVGLRTPWTLEDPQVWQKSQRVAGWTFALGGLVFMAQAWLQWQVKWVFGVTIGLMVGLPVVASYVFSRKKN